MKVKIFSLLSLAIGFAACNSNGDKTATTDSTTTKTTMEATTPTTTTTSTTNYSAMADSFRTNSTAGHYLNARTGKPIRIRYDVTKHRAVDETTGEPVWRYVDKRTWWVYGPGENDSWNQVGTAKMQGDKLLYQGDGDKWMTYDERWKAEDEHVMNSMNTDSMNNGSNVNGATKIADHGNKVKDENSKVKVSDHGNKVKIKDKNQ